MNIEQGKCCTHPDQLCQPVSPRSLVKKKSLWKLFNWKIHLTLPELLILVILLNAAKEMIRKDDKKLAAADLFKINNLVLMSSLNNKKCWLQKYACMNGIFHWSSVDSWTGCTYCFQLLDRSCRRIDLERELKQTQNVIKFVLMEIIDKNLPSTNWIESDDFPENKLRN